MSPFEILQQDIDNFILLANYLINLGKTSRNEAVVQETVDDGFWDF